MRGEVLKGHLDLLILAVVADQPLHGYAVIEALRERSQGVFDLPEGTVYPALHRLEKAGVLSSQWGEVAGRRRRSYQLTDKGMTALSVQQAGWQQFRSAMTATLRGAPWPTAI